MLAARDSERTGWLASKSSPLVGHWAPCSPASGTGLPRGPLGARFLPLDLAAWHLMSPPPGVEWHVVPCGLTRSESSPL